MKLTGDLKTKVEAAENIESAKDIIEEAGMELTEDELEGVAGGFWPFHKKSHEGDDDTKLNK